MGFFGYISVAFCLLGFLYALKALLFRHIKSAGLLVAFYLLGLALTVPIVWLISPDWDNKHVFHIAIWVGDPIGVLAVPCVSFFVDMIRGHRDMGLWRVRVPFEMLLIAPIWFYVWIWIQFICFDWIWI